jgi:hypothetical protein
VQASDNQDEMSRPRLDRARVAELYQASGAGRWGVSADAFESRLDAAIAHALDGGAASPADVNRVLNGLHVEDLALAMACEAGQAAAWEHFASQYRPVLQRAAAAIDPTGRAADLADVLFADLYGADVRDGERRPSFATSTDAAG